MLDNDAELSFQLFGLKGQGGQFVVQGREAGGEVFIDPDESHALPDATGIPCNKICGDCRGRNGTFCASADTFRALELTTAGIQPIFSRSRATAVAAR